MMMVAGKHIDPVTHVSLYCSMIPPPFIASVNSNLSTALTAQNTAENSCILSYTQNVTALQPSLFLTGIHLLLVASKGLPSFPNTNHCQGQLQTPQSVSSPRIQGKFPKLGKNILVPSH